MNFETWEPVYEAILADFGYDRSADERARDCLQDLLDGEPTRDTNSIGGGGDTVAIAAPGPSLEADIDAVRSADAVFAASTAGGRLLESGLDVDCLVTDLDKHLETVASMTRAGTPVVVHAHGDNISAVRAVVPEARSESLVPTTQAEPRPPVRNFGGFTDGDRAAFLADHLGADRLTFPGWEFDDPTVGETKARKLQWAERLLYWLERRRDDRFAVLDGRRDEVETDALPL